MYPKTSKLISFTTLVIMLIGIMVRNLYNMDEVWLFNYILNLSNGSLPYKEVGFMVTPFSFFLPAAAMTVLPKELYVYRIFSFLIYGAVYFLLSKEIRKRCKWDLFPQVLLSLFFLCFVSIMNYEYNILNVFWLILIICLETRDKKDKNTYFLIGILLALMLITKQSTGIIAAIIATVVSVINKEKKNQYNYKIYGYLVVITLFFVYLLANSILFDFLDFAVFGLGGFTSNVDTGVIVSSLVTHGIIFVPLLIYYIVNGFMMAKGYFKKEKITKFDKNKRTTFLYTLVALSVTYPLFDYFHFALGFMPLLAYAFIDLTFYLSKKNKRNLPSIICGIFVIVLIITLPKKYYDADILYEKEHFHGIPIEQAAADQLEIVEEKVIEYKENGYEVYILDPMAGFYFIPLDIWHNRYDVFLNGNLGSKSPEFLMREISKENNIIFVQKNEINVNYQMPHGISKMLLENEMEIIDECSIYHIYQKKGVN